MKRQSKSALDDSTLRICAEERLRLNSGGIAIPPVAAEAQRLLHELQVHQIELEMQNEELRRAEEETKDYLTELSAIYQYAPFIMLLVDGDRRVRKANEFAATYAKLTTEMLRGLRSCEALRCIHALAQPQGCGFGEECQQCTIRKTILDTLESGCVHQQVEASLVTSAENAHELRTFLLSSVQLSIRGVLFVLVSLMDITERKRTEKEREELTAKLRHSEKMSAVGQLAGGIAHNFNNQLAGILGFSDLLLGKLEDATLLRYATGIITATSRAAELTTQLLAFSRKGKYLSLRVDLHQLIAETSTLLSNIIDKRISIKQSLTAPSAIITGDPTQLQNMLLNFGLNARDAMPSGGELSFATEEYDLVGEQASALEVVPGRYIRTTIADSGFGMSADTQKHLFEPFFTTKEAGKGTGLGLAAGHGTVISHRGAIVAQSAEGKGTVFTVYLPLAGEDTTNQNRETPRVPLRGQARVVIVDDDRVVLDLTSEMLRDLGYEVATYIDSVEAIDAYRAHWREIDLIILDIVMPRLGGHDVFLAMREINPQLRVLISSGYSLEGEANAILSDGARAFLQKPFSKMALSHKLAEVLSM